MAARRGARRLYSARDMSRAVRRMAEELTPRLAQANPVVLAVMQGGAFTAIELCGHFDFPHEFDYVHLTRYDGGLKPGKLEWRVRPRAALAGRTVLVVDDILDRGHTLKALQLELGRLGVAAQLTAVLVVKRLVRHGRQPHVDAAGVEVDDVYVFGCGMDYRGYWRELRGLYALNGGVDNE